MLSDLLPFIVSGIGTGTVFGLAGCGLVVSYRASGIFNLGYGALATAAAYLFYWLHVSHNVNWVVAFVVAVLVAGPLMGLGMERLVRELAKQRMVMKIVGTLGLILVVQGLATIIYGPDSTPFPQYLPHALEYFSLGGTNVTYAQTTIAVVSVVAALLLYALFRWTRAGLEMRAVVDSAQLLATKGSDPVRVQRTAWIISSTFAALAGVLVAPLIGLDPIGLTLLAIQAFGAAALGMFKSIPLTFGGGILIGIGSSISTKYVVSTPWLSGLPSTLPFVVLFLVLLALPRRKLVSATRGEARPPLEWRAPIRIRGIGAVATLAVLVVIPLVVGTKLSFFTTGLTDAILFLSLGLLIKTSGQISLCHTAFAAVGAAAFSQLAVDHHWPWILAVLAASVIVIPVGALLAIPAIRLSGLFLALATFGFGIMMQYLFYPLNIMFTSSSFGRQMPRPSFAGSDRAFYYVALVALVLVSLGMLLLQHSRLGRMLKGLSDSPTAVSVMGLSINTTKVVAFCISSFVASLAGILYGASINIVGGGDTYYTSFTSLQLVAILILTPFASVPWYAIFGGLMMVIPQAFIPGLDTPYWMTVIFGVFAVMVSAQGGPQQMPMAIRHWLDRIGSSTRAGTGRTSEADSVEPSMARPAPAGSGLRVDAVSVRFGGLTAVRDLTLSAPYGKITGLIGPNGAGKTTTFNACFGLNRPVGGRVFLDDTDISRLSPASRARRGLGRTFQVVELCESLTVKENVSLGHETSLAGGQVISQLWAPRSERRATAEATAAALHLCGIEDIADRQAGELSTGQRRLVELARCLAGPFDLLLLDEPSSGLDRAETAQFAEVLNRIVAERQTGILLVEHDMSLIMTVCSYVYVLDFGSLLYEGTPTEVASSDIVRDAYLGADVEDEAQVNDLTR